MGTVNVRLRDIRKYLKKTQKDFGAKIGVSRDVISNLEYDRVEPSEIIIKSICREYGVAYDWLKYGDGEMFVGSDGESIAAVVDELMAGENETAKAVFRAFVKMDESDWLTVKKLILDISQDIKNEPGNKPGPV